MRTSDIGSKSAGFCASCKARGVKWLLRQQVEASTPGECLAPASDGRQEAQRDFGQRPAMKACGGDWIEELEDVAECQHFCLTYEKTWNTIN